MTALEDEYIFRSGNGYTLYINNDELSLMDNKDNIKYVMYLPDIDIVNNIKGMLESLGNVVRIKNNNKNE